MTATQQAQANGRSCPGCGMSREDWPDDQSGGYDKHGTIFCCHGCAQGTGCTCRPIDSGVRAPTKEELRDDAQSADFVQSLQRETTTVDAADYGTPVTRQPSAPPSASND